MALITLTSLLLVSCSSEAEEMTPVSQDAILATFDGRIDLENLPNYANQEIPNYINDDNTATNFITDGGVVLGRVLFYDKNLSIDNTVSCSSCHQQSFAFSDPDAASTGVNGTTGRHSMRLINARFADGDNFFWDERANTLELQTTMPIQDHVEMGFSGEDGNEDIQGLCDKMETIDYYNELFTFVYGDSEVTEKRMQLALAQFIRSIQSFDSKYDAGRSQVADEDHNFPNFTDQENKGKELFSDRPEFNNPAGEANGPFMHTGFSVDFEDVLDHYNNIPDVVGLDRRLNPQGNPQNLAMTQEEKEAVIAFIKTLGGTDVYTNEKWSDPF